MKEIDNPINLINNIKKLHSVALGELAFSVYDL